MKVELINKTRESESLTGNEPMTSRTTVACPIHGAARTHGKQSHLTMTGVLHTARIRTAELIALDMLNILLMLNRMLSRNFII